jgi:hypothetical protein
MSSPQMTGEKVVGVRNFPAEFKITAGPLVWDGQPLKETFVLEIHYQDSERVHSSRLPLNGFNSFLCFDYAEKSHELAEQFCEENGLMLCEHLNSWPQYQSVVQVDFGKRVEKVATSGKLQLQETLKKHKTYERPGILHGVYKQLVESNKGRRCSGSFSTLPKDAAYNREAFNDFAGYVADQMDNYSHLRNQASKLRQEMYTF